MKNRRITLTEKELEALVYVLWSLLQRGFHNFPDHQKELYSLQERLEALDK